MKYYTIGEVYRLGLLKNHKGQPYTAKATISRVFSKLKAKEKKTPWGMSKIVSELEIEQWNNRWEN